IAEEQVVGAQGDHQVVHQGNVARFVQRLAFGKQTDFGQDLLGTFVTGFGNMNLLALFIDPEVAFGLVLVWTRLLRHAGQHGRDHVHAHVQLGIVFGLSGDDQRCTGFVDQDGVNFVDNRVGQTALAAILGAVFHIVAQVVKTKFVVGTVGNVSLIGSNLLG